MKTALRVGLIYLVLGALWIYFSDTAINRVTADPETVRRLQTWKGWAFVLVSASLIVYLVRGELLRARESGRRFQALVEQSLAGVYLIRGGRFLYVNPKLARAFGYEPEEMVRSVAVEDVVAEEDRERVLGNLAHPEGGAGDELHYRFTGVGSDGGRIRVEVHGRRVAWEGESAVLGVLLDVGEQERLEARAREAQKLEGLGKLTGQIAHDFNNFLTAIIGPLDLSLDTLSGDPETRRELEEARSAAHRAASLSRKLLAFSRSRPSLPRSVDVNRVLDEMRPFLDRIVAPGADLRFDLHPEPCAVEIDPSDLEQVVMNLALNAAEASEDGGSIVIRTGRSDGGDLGDGQVWLDVEDDGAGMPPATRDRVFEPFFTTKSDGTGLGLSIVFGIVTQAHGTIDVHSQEGGGTRFHLSLPATEQSPERGLHGLERDAARSARPLGTGQTILLVEDEEAVRRTIARALERFGYRVLVAEGVEAAEAAASAPDARVDLVLTDVQLRDGLGPEVVDRVSALHPETRILYASGYSDQRVAERIAATPNVRLLEKPFSVEALLWAVREALHDDGGRGSGASGA